MPDKDEDMEWMSKDADIEVRMWWATDCRLPHPDTPRCNRRFVLQLGDRRVDLSVRDVADLFYHLAVHIGLHIGRRGQ